MRKFMFKNRWGALLFVGVTAFSAASLIGGKDDEGLLLTATDKLTRSKTDFEDRAADFSEPRPRPVLDANPGGEFSSEDDLMDALADDEALIDTTDGFDPRPDVDPNFESDSIAAQGDGYIIVDDDEIE